MSELEKLWTYTEQVNNFYRIEEADPIASNPNKSRVVCFTMNEKDAKVIVTSVNAYKRAIAKRAATEDATKAAAAKHPAAAPSVFTA